jgi:hypothetical protein
MLLIIKGMNRMRGGEDIKYLKYERLICFFLARAREMEVN